MDGQGEETWRRGLAVTLLSGSPASGLGSHVCGRIHEPLEAGLTGGR